MRKHVICDRVVLILIAGVVTAISAPAVAKEYRLCIGEYDQRCPVSHNVFAGCGASPDIVAADTCAKTTRDGKKESVPYRLIHQGSHGGNRCGYEWYLIECQDK